MKTNCDCDKGWSAFIPATPADDGCLCAAAVSSVNVTPKI